MKVQDKDLFHGAALTQVVEHKSFKALNRASAKYGHYLVNTDRHVFVKYRTSNHSPWLFTIQPDEIKALRAAVSTKNDVFLCLVCGQTTVCALDRNEIRGVIDLTSVAPQWIRVEIPKGGSCHVSGSIGYLKHAITHSSFPDKVFG